MFEPLEQTERSCVHGIADRNLNFETGRNSRRADLANPRSGQDEALRRPQALPSDKITAEQRTLFFARWSEEPGAILK
jgi:hypothetical protein